MTIRYLRRILKSSMSLIIILTIFRMIFRDCSDHTPYKPVKQLEWKYNQTTRPQGKHSNNKNTDVSPLNPNSSRLTATEKIITPPGIILKVWGGLGNQLFQYACTYALSRTMSLPLYLFLPSNIMEVNDLRNPNARGFEMQFFNDGYDKLIDEKTEYNSSDVFKFTDYHILHKKIPKDKLLELSDYCQGEIFFQPYGPEIVKMFDMKTELLNLPQIADFIQQIEDGGNGSVAVHVRRGDFLQVTGFETPISYQKQAIEIISKQLSKEKELRFFVFSDDIEFAIKELISIKEIKNSTKFIFVSSKNTSGIQEFYLMTQCRHIIVANSTFSWWAAYLIKNKNKVIIRPAIGPNYFDHYEAGYVRDFKKLVVNKYWYPPSWIVIDPFK